MADDAHNEINEAQLLAINALKEAITTLEKYPNALNAYLSTEKKILMEAKWLPDMISSLLFTLKAQKTILETLKIDQDNFKIVEEAEYIALDAAKTVMRIAKTEPRALETFLTAQNKFYMSYSDSLENPRDNIYALRDFINAEITVLENEELKSKVINNAHNAIVKAIKTAFSSLEKYPEALSAFLDAEKASLEKRGESGMTQTLLDSHLLLLRGQKSLLSLYEEQPYAYEAFTNMAMLSLKNRKETYQQLKESAAKSTLLQSLGEFETHYKEFISNPAAHIQSFTDFLNGEIARLQTISLTEPQVFPV